MLLALIASVLADTAQLRCADRVFSLPERPFMQKLLTRDGLHVTAVDHLPEGLTLHSDRPAYRYISGTAPAPGQYTYTVRLDDGTSREMVLTVSPDLPQPTPFMGLLTWNSFEGHISDDNIKALADAFHTFGLKDAGYSYMCIDDKWAAHDRQDGHLVWGDKFRDPAGVIDYVHEQGLKIGIYSDAGSRTCSGAQPGSYGYEQVDASDFLSWGFDLLKYDFCNATGGTDAPSAEKAYKAMGDALSQAEKGKKAAAVEKVAAVEKAATEGKPALQAAAPSPFVYYMCEWGDRKPWEWAARTGATCWRATADTRDYWSDTTYRGGVLQVLSVMKEIWAYQGVNRWNDADMLMVGLHGTGYSSNDGGGAGYPAGLTQEEARTNFALWCMFASPLTLSCNITNLDGLPNSRTGKPVTNPHYREDLDIILNRELIAIDQDPLGQAGEPIIDTPDCLVMQKDLADGSIALSITNLSSQTRPVSVPLSLLSALKPGQPYQMRDLWHHAYLTSAPSSAGSTPSVLPLHADRSSLHAQHSSLNSQRSSLNVSPSHTILTTADTFIDTLPTHATHIFRLIPVDM